MSQNIDNGDWYAIKIMKENQVNSSEKLLYFMNEVRLLSQLNQNHIVEIVAASIAGTLIKARGTKKTVAYYVMAYARYGELYRITKETGRFTEIQARTFFFQLLDGNLSFSFRAGNFAFKGDSTS